MKTWVLSVVGVALVSVLADVMLPDGDTKKYARTAISAVIALTVFAPALNLFTSFPEEIFAFESQATTLQQPYLDSVSEKRSELLRKQIASILQKNGVGGAVVSCFVGADGILSSAEIDLSKATCKDCGSEGLRAKVIGVLTAELGEIVEKVVIYEKIQ